MESGLHHTVLKGDVMAKTATGGVFWADDPAVEQPRLDGNETCITGPMFGHKMMGARDDAGVLESDLLAAVGLDPTAFKVFAKLAEGTRRPIFVRPGDLTTEAHQDGIVVSFFLPKGCYASVMLREFASEGAADADG